MAIAFTPNESGMLIFSCDNVFSSITEMLLEPSVVYIVPVFGFMAIGLRLSI
jgi:hypothetical protein